MNKKIKIIDLMQKCADKENIPERILYKNTAFVLNDYKCYYNEEIDERLLDYIIPTFSNLIPFIVSISSTSLLNLSFSTLKYIFFIFSSS